MHVGTWRIIAFCFSCKMYIGEVPWMNLTVPTAYKFLWIKVNLGTIYRHLAMKVVSLFYFSVHLKRGCVGVQCSEQRVMLNPRAWFIWNNAPDLRVTGFLKGNTTSFFYLICHVTVVHAIRYVIQWANFMEHVMGIVKLGKRRLKHLDSLLGRCEAS